MTTKAQSEAPSVDALDKIFEEYQLGNATLKYQAGIDQAKAKINRLITEARQDELAKTCLGGMGGLTPEQQDYITNRLKELTEQLGER